jgi:hypothetical protein
LLSIKKNGIAERKPTAASRPSANRQVVKFKTRAASRQLSTAKPSSSKPGAASRPVINGQTVKFKTRGRFAAVINRQVVKFKTNGGSQSQCPGFELILLAVGELLGGWRTAR